MYLESPILSKANEFDYETSNSYNLTVKVDDGEYNSNTVILNGNVLDVDEQLGGPGVGSGRGKGHHPLQVALARRRIVLEIRQPPLPLHLRVPVDAELDHEIGDDAEEPALVVETSGDRLVEPIGSQW